MTTFAVLYTYTDDHDRRLAVRPEHRAYLEAQPGMLVAGAWAPDEPAGGLLIFRADDRAAVQTIVDGDPYNAAGVISDVQIREWAPPLGPVASALNDKA
ncbi:MULTISPECIES: YciI family protein [Pseudonocardia]|uniref:YciI-like protein n=1 Tax=Pseudonocardia autotrophica TaxID=2074 RepID=A0A1Y2N0T4_PSEAH|nr:MULTISPECIES: YciI family protein [Pseudonocardia]OSY41012.1 YciI-like protein [Pseudonocardia autotrophica]